MSDGDSFNLNVVSESGVIYYGKCKLLFVPSSRHDTVAIMAQHTPMIMLLGKGQVVVKDGHAKRVLADLESGIVYVAENDVSVLVNL